MYNKFEKYIDVVTRFSYNFKILYLLVGKNSMSREFPF